MRSACFICSLCPNLAGVIPAMQRMLMNVHTVAPLSLLGVPVVSVPRCKARKHTIVSNVVTEREQTLYCASSRYSTELLNSLLDRAYKVLFEKI